MLLPSVLLLVITIKVILSTKIVADHYYLYYSPQKTLSGKLLGMQCIAPGEAMGEI